MSNLESPSAPGSQAINAQTPATANAVSSATAEQAPPPDTGTVTDTDTTAGSASSPPSTTASSPEIISITASLPMMPSEFAEAIAIIRRTNRSDRDAVLGASLDETVESETDLGRDVEDEDGDDDEDDDERHDNATAGTERDVTPDIVGLTTVLTMCLGITAEEQAVARSR